MKLSMPLSYAGNFAESARQVVELEKAGLDVVWVAFEARFPSSAGVGETCEGGVLRLTGTT